MSLAHVLSRLGIHKDALKQALDEIQPPRVVHSKPAQDYSEKLRRRTKDVGKVNHKTVRETR